MNKLLIALAVVLVTLLLIFAPLAAMADNATPETMVWVVMKAADGKTDVHIYTFFHEETKSDHPFALTFLCEKHKMYEVTFIFGDQVRPVPLHFKTLEDAKAYVEEIALRIYKKYQEQTGA